MDDQSVESAAPPAETAPPRPATGRRWLLLGFLIAAAGIPAYAVQVRMHHLSAPWYLLALSAVGLACIAYGLAQKRSIVGFLALALVAGLTAFESFFLFGLRLPQYTGPVASGKAFPAFATERADGSAFAQADLKGERDNVLVFFRGRW